MLWRYGIRRTSLHHRKKEKFKSIMKTRHTENINQWLMCLSEQIKESRIAVETGDDDYELDSRC